MAALLALCVVLQGAAAQTVTPSQAGGARQRFEYLWMEAENMRGLATDARNEPRIYASYVLHKRESAPGWGINGPGVSAEWSQGGESEWNSVAASPDEVKATIYRDVEIPRDGRYRVWVRYADWGGRDEEFAVRVRQGGSDASTRAEVFNRRYGTADRLDPRDEVVMYWGWAFAWEGSDAEPLRKGAARVSIDIERASSARRHVDCILITDDLSYVPEGRRKPPFAALRVLKEWGEKRTPLASLAPVERATSDAAPAVATVPPLWRRRPLAGRDFVVPWNISENFWELYGSAAPEQRPLYPFNAEPHDLFIEKYKGVKDVPIFSSKLVVPVVYINNLPKHLKEGSPFLKYLRETRAPFGFNINYGAASMSAPDAQAAWALLNGELREQFIGWVSGESIGHVYEDAAPNLTLTPDMTRARMLEGWRSAYDAALQRKWGALFQTQTGPMWDKLIPAQATSSTTYAHALTRWGVRLLGLETAAVQPNFALRVAFTRGAARQYDANFLYYHAPNFGDTATTFTHAQNFAGPAHFFHSRYGASMGPSLSWYRKCYFFYYMAGASAVYLEQGFDQFFKPAPGEHPFQLNPLGRITDEFVRFAERHPERGTPYTPVAFLLDPAHGFEMTDYPHWPFGVSQIERGDHALRELFGAAYYPAPETEGEPATADRQAFVNSIFGDLFDVLVASDDRRDAADAYRTIIVGGRVDFSQAWVEKLIDHVQKGGTLLVNAEQARWFPEQLLGVRGKGATAEAADARCLSKGETPADLSGQTFRYERVEPRGAEALLAAPTGDALVTVNRVGRGRVVYCAIPDLLGLDERLAPAAAHTLVHLLADAAPVRVRGDVQHLVNRNERGWVVTLINNRGVYKQQQGLAQVNREEAVDVTLDLRGRTVAGASEWTTDTQLGVEREGGGRVRLSVPPGGVRIVELITGK
ncbi:MAG TPA: hypothetical protein VF240_12605 [Pyrinomonadaceae bacterium]